MSAADDPVQTPEAARIERLIARMSLDEKAGQLSLFALAAGTADPNPSFNLQSRAEQIEAIRAGQVTGLFNGYGPVLREMQRVAVEQSRLGVPLLFGADVIHGFRTVFPIPLAEAASWEPALAERTARAAALEASAQGLRWTFAPMVDVARDARWGRALEGAGEDVLLGRRFAEARVRGYQGERLDAPDALAATVKHFAAYGAAEAGLDYATAEISEHTLHEVYLPPFRAALGAGAASLMTAFNDIGGVPANANAALLRGLLRQRWGFEGPVVSDYTADRELIAHGIAGDEREAARLSFLAGVDISMQSGLYLRYLPELVAKGAVPLQRLDEAVRRVLWLKTRLGLFDDPYGRLGARPAPAQTPVPQFRALAREAARRSLVLLRNESGLLPLPRRGCRLALIGPFAEAPADRNRDLNGPWTLFGDDREAVDLATGLRAALADPGLLNVVRGSDVDAPLAGGVSQAVAAADAADVVLLALGESAAMSGESRSRAEIVVPAAQQALAEAVAATGKPIVLLLRNGRPLALQGALRQADAILVTWFLGSEAGNAIADVVFGDYAPSGRLPMSFPRSPGQVPYTYAHRATGRPTDSATGEYGAHYLGLRNAPLYPFGHGLGYSRIEYRSLTLQHSHLAWDGRLRVSAQIANTGARSAEEVVQLYLRDPAASIARPVRELKDFRKLRIAAGGTVQVEFELGREDLSFIGADTEPTVEAGRFELWVGPSAAEGLHAEFELLPP